MFQADHREQLSTAKEQRVVPPAPRPASSSTQTSCPPPQPSRNRIFPRAQSLVVQSTRPSTALRTGPTNTSTFAWSTSRPPRANSLDRRDATHRIRLPNRSANPRLMSAFAVSVKGCRCTGGSVDTSLAAETRSSTSGLTVYKVRVSPFPPLRRELVRSLDGRPAARSRSACRLQATATSHLRLARSAAVQSLRGRAYGVGQWSVHAERPKETVRNLGMAGREIPDLLQELLARDRSARIGSPQ